MASAIRVTTNKDISIGGAKRENSERYRLSQPQVVALKQLAATFFSGIDSFPQSQ
jgi:hypothetical protein